MDTKRAPQGVLSLDTFFKTQDSNGFFYVGDLRKTLKKHNLPFTGKRRVTFKT